MEYVGIIEKIFKIVCKKARKTKAINNLEEVPIVAEMQDFNYYHLSALQEKGYLVIIVTAQYPDILYINLTSKAINNYANWYVMKNR